MLLLFTAATTTANSQEKLTAPVICDAQTIPAYLKDPNHYWSFFGAKPGGNFFVATGHEFWKPTPEMFRPIDSKRTNKDNPYVLTPKKPE